MDITERELKYLGLLSKQFPNAASAASEIMNLQAILNLPKGTEHFLADIHGEYEAFIHVLKNASGTIRTKVESLFAGQIREQELHTHLLPQGEPRATSSEACHLYRLVQGHAQSAHQGTAACE